MPRRRDVGLARRRPIKDEDEAEVDVEGDIQDDSVSEDSGISEDEDFDDGESDATYSDEDTEEQTPAEPNGKPTERARAEQKAAGVEAGKRDNHAMMNGIRGDDDAPGVDFADLGEDASTANANGRNHRQRSRHSKKANQSGRQKPSRTNSNGAADFPKQQETAVERRRREHEEYRKKRDADPAFVPNRGAFFMHDHRSGGGGANGFRPFGKGKGRGGAAAVATQSSSNAEPTEITWEHDMHEEVAYTEREREKGQEKVQEKKIEKVQEKPVPQRSAVNTQGQLQKDEALSSQTPIENQVPNPIQSVAASQPSQSQNQTQIPNPNPNQNQTQSHSTHHQIYTRFVGDAPPRSFGRTVNKGTVQIRVSLPGMEKPIPFNDAPYKVYTRLPFHRPPLRRDKPVRIFLPGSSPKYIYPAHARSFVFIPRAMRPGGSRGGIVGGGLGPTPPRRGSYFGQQQHQHPQHRPPYSYVSSNVSQAPSVDMSQRSTMQHEVVKPPDASANIMQPIVPPVMPSEPARNGPVIAGEATATSKEFSEHALKPVVRLPASAPQVSTSPTKQIGVKIPSSAPVKPPYPVPPRPVGIPMHQPRPQKTVSVENIESPAVLTYTPQPYPTPSPYEPNYYMNSHSRAPSYPSQPSSTPHSMEHSIHARPFQPNPNYPPHVPPPPNGYFYPMSMYQGHPQATAAQTGPPPPYVASMPYTPQQMPQQMPHHQMPPPMPMPMQQQMHPPMPQPMPQQSPSMSSPQTAVQPQGTPVIQNGRTTIAHESNGTVYFYDPAQYYALYGNVPPNVDQTQSGVLHTNGMYYYPQMVPVPVMAPNTGQPMYYS